MGAARPSGTVTFLFSDIEDSTRLWEAHGEEMAAALRLHDSLMRSAIGASEGYVFSTAGDAFAVAFARAGQAIVAAVEAQRALAAVDWGSVEIKVRMGIHTGEADERDGDYFGPALNRGARLMSAAHGGQVLASGVTARLVTGGLPANVVLVDLGEHRLKDLDVPEHVFQVTDVILDRHFPPLRCLDVAATRLPRTLTRFIGRRREIEELTELVPGRRLVTLTGGGGVGKTRLALQVAAEVFDCYRDGVWFVDLSGVTDPAQVPKQVAVAMGVQEQADRPMVSTLLDRLRRQETLIILDNCEHLVDGVARLVDELLGSTTEVSVVATSRETLGVPGEVVWIVPPMRVPEAGQELLADNEAVALFVDRARLLERGFALTAENGPACAEICRHLDGVPLAIELAAARVGVLSPREIADRLGDSMALLTGGARTAAARQQTLRAAIDWSYGLLGPNEQALLRSLAVFRGGFTLEAAQAIWSPREPTASGALDLLGRLVDKSLVTVTPTDRGRRFTLLETVRAYAWERLEQAGEAGTMLERHREFFLHWAHRQSKRVTTPDQLTALAALEADHDNLRAVLERALAEPYLEDALLLAADLSFFWFVHSHFGESGAWYDKLLAERERVDTRAQIKLLLGAGEFSENTGDHVHAVTWFEEARRLARSSGSPRMEGWALFNLFNAATFEMDLDRARDLCDDALERFTVAGDQYGIGLLTFTQASLDLIEYRLAGSVREEDAEEVLFRLEPMLEVVRAVGERNVLGHALEVVGTARLMSHRAGSAACLMADAVDAFDTLGNQSCLAHCLDRVAWLADETARPDDAVRLLAATEALRERIGIAAPPIYAYLRDSVRESASAKMFSRRFDTAWQEGGAMDGAAAVGLAHGIAEATSA